MKRKVMTLLTLVTVTLAGLLAPSSPASAAGTCSLYVPSKVSINQPYRGITVPLGPNCTAANFEWADWEAYHPTYGLQNALFYTAPTTSQVWNLYDWEPLGRWQWRPAGAYDQNFAPIYQYTYYTDVRLASYGRVTATRYGTKVSLRTTAARYWSSGDRFIAWSSARGQIQYRVPGTTTWRGLKDVYSNTSGVYGYTYYTSAVRDYRVVFYAVPTIWNSTSPVIRK